jgi:hypothetical protein
MCACVCVCVVGRRIVRIYDARELWVISACAVDDTCVCGVTSMVGEVGEGWEGVAGKKFTLTMPLLLVL